MPNRVAIFIDGAYLENVLKHEFKDTRVDFQALSSRLLKKGFYGRETTW